jgi:hypothetical protein
LEKKSLLGGWIKINSRNRRRRGKQKSK